MKMRVISSKEEIDTISKNEKMIHIAFRPSNTDILAVISKCPYLKAIQIPPSYKRTISKSTQMLFEMQNISLIEGDISEHRKDTNEYSELSQEIYDKIDQYLSEGLTEKEIKEKMLLFTTLSNELLGFLIKSRKQ